MGKRTRYIFSFTILIIALFAYFIFHSGLKLPLFGRTSSPGNPASSSSASISRTASPVSQSEHKWAANDMNYCSAPRPKYISADMTPVEFAPQVILDKPRMYNEGGDGVEGYLIKWQGKEIAIVTDPRTIKGQLYASKCALDKSVPEGKLPLALISCGQPAKVKWDSTSNLLSFENVKFPTYWDRQFKGRYCGSLVAFWSLSWSGVGPTSILRANVADLSSFEEFASREIGTLNVESLENFSQAVSDFPDPQWRDDGKKVIFPAFSLPASIGPGSTEIEFAIPSKNIGN